MDLVTKRVAPLLAAIVLLLGAAPALAHAERSASAPEPNERLKEPPAEISVTFTEPPIADADFKVFDGCTNDVVDQLDVQGMDITAALAEGQPGKWKVAFHVVSGIDGHATKDSFGFTVQGPKDCQAASETPPPSADGPDEPEEGESSMGLIAAFAGATLLAVVIALLLRGRKS